MMNSYRRRSGQVGKLLAAFVFILVVFFGDKLSGGVLRHALWSFGSGVSGALSRVGTDIGGSGIFATRASLETEVRELQGRLQAQTEDIAAAGAISDENAQLRAMLGLAATEKGVAAPVISSVIASPYGTFLIGAGLAEGVVKGSLVLTSGGFVVGVVSETASHSALVTEVLAPGASVDAVIRGAAVRVDGAGGENGRAQLPRESLTQVGDAVLAPQFGQRPIGIVGAVASSSSSASQDVYLSLPEHLSALRFLYVIAPRD